MLRLAWEATRVVVFVVPCSPPLGTEFLPLEPRLSVQTHGALQRITLGLLTCLVDSMSHIVWAFHLTYAFLVLLERR